MKNRKKIELIWLMTVIFFYICYNLPMIPRYGQAFPAFVHGLVTLIPLWLSTYVGLFLVCRAYPLRKRENALKDKEKARKTDAWEEEKC